MEKNQWVYFLKITPQLPDSFFQLNTVLAKHGINLLPVELDQLSTLVKVEGTDFSVILCLSQFAELKIFENKVRKSLQRMLDLLGFRLTLLTSFDRLLLSGKGNKNKNIVRFLLPINLHMVSLFLAHQKMEQKSKDKKWEWGRSPKLSPEIY